MEHYVDMVAVVEPKIRGKQANNLCLALGFDKWRCMVIVWEFGSFGNYPLLSS